MKKLLISLILFFSSFLFFTGFTFPNNTKIVMQYNETLVNNQTGYTYFENNNNVVLNSRTDFSENFTIVQSNNTIFSYPILNYIPYIEVFVNDSGYFVTRIYKSSNSNYNNKDSFGAMKYYCSTTSRCTTSSTSGSGITTYIDFTSSITYNSYIAQYGSEYIYYDIIFPEYFFYDYKGTMPKLYSEHNQTYVNARNESITDLPLVKYASDPEPDITFTSQDYSTNNEVYKKDVTIDFGFIDNDNYAYMYLDTNENIWHTLYLTSSPSYTLSIYSNTNIIAQVIDKINNDVFTSASYLVNNITTDLNIEIENIPTKVDNEVVFYETFIKYYSDTRNNYIYDYTTSNYYVNGNYEFLNVPSNENEVHLRNYNNITIIARIKDLQGNILFTKTSEINLMLNEPKITFTELDNREISDVFYNSYISSVKLFINYGYIDTSEYIYLYKKDTDENWTTFNPIDEFDKNVGLDINENCNIIARVLNKSDNTVFTQANFTIYKISSPNNNSSFLGPLKNIFDNNDWRNLLGIFTNFFNTIAENRIISYILLIITTSIIILLLKSMKR